MTNIKLCGMDINGISDAVARNWFIRPDGETEFVDEARINDGGKFSSIVKSKLDNKPQLIGGSQANLAPHGRGGGWGDVGDTDNRMTIRGELDSQTLDPKKLAAAIRGIVSNPSHAILAIDDCLTTTDIKREAFIDAFRINKTKKFLLVWRPVLLALKEIEEENISSEESIGIICHSMDGLIMQTLKIKETSKNGTAILAPERKSLGLLIPTNFGYRHLEEMAIKSASTKLT